LKKQYFLFALISLLLPILLRTFWFYQGIYIQTPGNQSPDYGRFLVPQPSLSTQPAIQPSISEQKKTVLIDYAHTNRFSLAEIDNLTNLLILKGNNIQIDKDGKDLPAKLQDADAYVIIAPTVAFAREYIQSIRDFVMRGGHLLIIADPTRTYQNYYFDMEDSVLIVNQIIDPFEIAFKTDYVYSITHNEGNFRNIYAVPAANNPLSNNLSSIVFYGSHSLAGNFVPLLNGDSATLSSGSDQGGNLTVAATSRDGNILFMGDMGFMVTPYNQVSDNHQLVINIAEFLGGNSRARSISDFPNLFTRPVVILQNADLSMDKGLLSEVSILQSTFLARSLPVSISNQPAEGKDLLVLGVYPPSGELNPLLEASGFFFKSWGSPGEFAPTAVTEPDGEKEASNKPVSSIITIAFSNDSFNIPGLGTIPSRGFNFIFYDAGKTRNTLFLLAESRKNLVDLIKLINKGTLKDCLVQPNSAVCPGGVAVKETPTPMTPTSTVTPTAATPLPASSTSTPSG
jgi:hypothetical protein